MTSHLHFDVSLFFWEGGRGGWLSCFALVVSLALLVQNIGLRLGDPHLFAVVSADDAVFFDPMWMTFVFVNSQWVQDFRLAADGFLFFCCHHQDCASSVAASVILPPPPRWPSGGTSRVKNVLDTNALYAATLVQLRSLDEYCDKSRLKTTNTTEPRKQVR